MCPQLRRSEWGFQRKCPFSFEPDEEPDQQLFKAFDCWIKIGLIKGHQRTDIHVKYEHHNEHLTKTLNFGTTATNQKSWLYVLHEPKQWLSDDKEFKNSGGKVDWDQQSALEKYILGGRLACSFSWTEVDQVYIPVNVETLKHWILLVLDISTRTITVYNSLKGDEDDDTIIREKIEPMATLLPILLDFLGLFTERKDDYGSAPFKVEHCLDNPQQDNTYVTYFLFLFCLRIVILVLILVFNFVLCNDSGDCGVFVIKYAEYLMHGYAISEVTQDKMHFFRRKLTFELYSHAMDKEENQVVSDLERD
ncbi:Ulp1 protease family, C-terminal catalytic domain containing protein [Trema orientale]|uniref:Ulp1 protease family, C-terminal catalytic domain containing protein n=1 Tax=Trema orientale TaxID=63057 RepID=A0A2P5EZB1_TREOI|nr:Ulp1 protease family, C-terminal catalytic domain containing protein [Trema orientale]